jgi:hypothetical protein
MLTGIDAEINENDTFTIDRFRIKIRIEDEFVNESGVYDSGLEANDPDENAMAQLAGV